MSIEKQLIKQKISILLKMIKVLQGLLKLLKKKPKLLLIHHTATNQHYTKAETINKTHKEKGYSISKLGFYCAYNEIITGDGIRHIARGEDENGQGALTCPDFHYDLCLTGNFNQDTLSEKQELSLREQLDYFQKQGYKIKLHQNFYATDCPGFNLIAWLRDNHYYEN